MIHLTEMFKSTALRSLGQLVFDISSGSVHSVECLMRPSPGSPFRTADSLFQYARDHHIEPQVRKLASQILTIAAASCIPPERLIIEVLEHESGADHVLFRRNVDECREVHIAIALDDFGAGQSNFQMLVRVRPGFVKLDAEVVRGIARDVYRHRVVVAALAMAKCIGFRLVAEGVETLEDLDALRELGIELCQGFVLCRPMPAEHLSAFMLGAQQHGSIELPHVATPGNFRQELSRISK